MPIKLLGPVEITDRHGHEIIALSERQRRLVAALAIDVGTPVSADRLLDRVWDDEEAPTGGVRALHTRISRLRPHLMAAGAEIATRGHSYVLEAHGDLDVAMFEQLVADGRAALSDGNTELGVERLNEAISLWRGDPYIDVAGLSWVQPEIARLEEIRSSALEHRFDALLRQGRHTQIVPTVREAIDSAPWRDRLRVQLALALYRSGRQAEALRGLAQYRREMIDELGLEPGPDIGELEAKILAQDPDLALAAAPARSAPGYHFHDVVGEGSFSVVWRATQPALGRQVAIKQIRSHLANRPEFIRRFEAEAQLVASLEHPFLVPLHDYWREPDGAFLVMRWLRGGTLSSRLLDGPLAPSTLAPLIGQVGAALRAAHRAGVIHRDVKPGNILFDHEGTAFLSDFGIAYGADDDAFAEAMSTGSPAYASPEQLRRDELDGRSDLYGLGIVVFEAATGRLPFAASSQAELVRAQLEDPVPRPSDIREGLPAWIDAVVAGCCAKERADRFAGVDEVLAAIPFELVGERSDPRSNRAGDGAGRNPYKGLRAFAESDTADFRGRRRLVDRFLEVLARPGVAGRLLVAVGASGSGKSSAVRAGLVPALRRGELAGSDRWLITTMIPGAHPFEELEAALLRVAASPPGPLVELMTADDRGITRAVRLAVPHDGAEVLVVIDQLEELFTLTDPDRRHQFLHGLITALREPRSGLRVVATIRADFWDRPLQVQELAAMLEHAAVTVGPLSADELEQAITEPARREGVEFASGLVARLIADVTDQPGALPLLQFTLTTLFDSQHGGVVAAEAYDEVGGIEGALASRAEAVHTDADDDVRRGMRRVAGELVTLGEGVPDTRRRVLLQRVAVDESTRTAVDVLGEARLLTFDHHPLTREPTVEIAHEALLTAWPRLRRWIDEDRVELRGRRALAAAADDWEAHDRDPDRLYRGTRLEDALELASDRGQALGETEAAFLSASRDQAEASARRSRRRTRTLQGLLAVAATLLVVALIAGFIAVGQRDDARVARLASEFDRMSAAAPVRAASDPRLGLLMAAEAHAHADNPESLGALQRTLLATGPILGYLGDPDRQYRDARWIDDSTVAAAHLGGVEVYDVRTGARTFDHAVEIVEVRNLRATDAGGVVAFGVSPDGRHVAVGTATNSVEVIDLITGDSRTLPHPTQVTSLAFHPDGSALATGDADGVVRIFDHLSGSLELDWVAHPKDAGDFQEKVAPLGMVDFYVFDSFMRNGVHDMEYLADGSLMTAVTPVVRRWDPSTGRQLGVDVFPPGDTAQFPERYRTPGLIITTMIDEVHPVDGVPPRLAVASRNYLVVVDGETGAQPSQTWLPTDRPDTNHTIAGSTVTTDGAWVIWLSDGRIRLLDEDGAPRMTVQPALLSPSALDLDPTGTRVVGAGDGGMVLVDLAGESLLSDSIDLTVPGDIDLTIPGDLATIAADGTLVAASSFGAGPTAFHRRTGAGWTRVELPPEIADHEAVVPIDIGGESLVQVYRGGITEVEEAKKGQLAPDETSWRDPETGAARFAIPGATFDQAVIADEEWIAVSGDGLTVDVWGIGSSTRVVSLDELAEAPEPRQAVLGGANIRSIDVSPDDDRLVATSNDGRVAMWEIATWEQVELPSDMPPTVVAGFSRDGRYFAAAGSTGEITLYDADTFDVVRVLRGMGIPDATCCFLEWSADGRHLLSLVDAVPRLWDLETGAQIGAPFPLTVGTRAGAASGDELRLVTTQDDALKIWNLDTESWAPIACRAAGRNMTLAEWESFGPAGEPYRSTCPQFPPGD